MDSRYQRPATRLTRAATPHSSLSNGRSALKQEVKSHCLKVRNPAEKIIQRVSHLRYIKRFHICSIQKYWPVISAKALIEGHLPRKYPTPNSGQVTGRPVVIHTLALIEAPAPPPRHAWNLRRPTCLRRRSRNEVLSSGCPIEDDRPSRETTTCPARRP